MAFKKSVNALRLFFLKIVFRILRAAITRKWLHDANAKDMMIALGIHPGIGQNPDLIFAKSLTQLDQKTKPPVEVKEKMVIYTCLTNGYDELSPPIYRDPNCDYVVFTDNQNLQVEGWTTRFLDNPLGIDSRRLSRWPKILPHRFLPNYSHSIYLDANLVIYDDLAAVISLLTKQSMALFAHSDLRNCVFQEAKVVIDLKADSSTVVNRQMKKYRDEGFPENFGLHECGLMVRRHYDPIVMECMEVWWCEILKNSHRDQLSFSYARWKVGLDVGTIEGNVKHNNLISRKSHNNLS